MNYKIFEILSRFILVVIFSMISISALSIWLKTIFIIVLLLISFKIGNVLEKNKNKDYIMTIHF
ncbi:hypothetical protein AMD00_03235 [Viridibacillus arvi]|uniref:Uncharacterized protein n=1 Tax=Viridibacillus arvi TaxID=263475 RepID=A0A0M0LLD0_9BACL|nr:hypothetical protein AMD00_03235 [Viridibacillus arvi]